MSDDAGLSLLGQVSQELAGLVLDDHGADGYRDDDVGSGAAVFVRPLPVTAGLGLILLLVAEIQ